MGLREAIILAVALVTAALLNGGVYTQSVISGSVYRLNRFTGSLDFCTGHCGCVAVPKASPATPRLGGLVPPEDLPGIREKNLS